LAGNFVFTDDVVVVVAGVDDAAGGNDDFVVVFAKLAATDGFKDGLIAAGKVRLLMISNVLFFVNETR
jgi:hypothetical protein